MKYTVPALQIDRVLFKNQPLPLHCRIERRIVAALCQHLQEAGFNLHSVYDGERTTRVRAAKAAMELIFNLDEASLRFYRDSPADWHGVLLVLGNGEDIVSDWNFFDDDRDGFDAAMTAFHPEQVV